LKINITEQFLDDRVGLTDDQMAEDLIKFSKTSFSVSKIVEKKRDTYLKLSRMEDLLNPGIIDFLDELTDFPKVLCTNSSIKDIEEDLIKYDLKKFFKAILTCESVKNPKPDPEIYLKASKIVGISPTRCLVFEDSLNGINAAISAKMKVVGITSFFSPEKFPP